MVTWWCGEILANTSVSEKLYTSVLTELKRQQNSIISDLVKRNYFTNNSFKVGDQVRIQIDVGSGNNGRVKVGDFIYYEPIEFMYQRRYISELHGVDSLENVRVDYRHFGSYFNQLYIDYILTSDDTKNTKNNEGVELPRLPLPSDSPCKNASVSEVGKEYISVYESVTNEIVKLNQYAKLSVLKKEHDWYYADECDVVITQLDYFLLGNERLRYEISLGWSYKSIGDWKGYLNITEANHIYIDKKIYIKNSNTWDLYDGDKSLIELDFDNIVKESDSRDYLEAISRKLDELKTKGCSFTDSDTNVVVPLGITTAMFSVSGKTLSIKQLLNLDYMYANNSIGEIGNISNAFEGIYTELPSMTAELLGTLGTAVKNAVKTIGGKFFIPFLAISSTLDAPQELDLFEPTEWVQENEELIKTGDFEGLANTIQIVSSKLIQELSSISQAVQNVAESTSQAIAKELQEVEMKVQPITIEENSKLGIDTSSLETSKVVIDPTALMEVLKSQGILIDTTKLAETLVTSKILLDTSSLADNKIGVDASSLDNATIKANVTGALTIADGQTIDSNMILDEQTKSAIKAQGDFAIAQKVLEEARAQREIDKEERDKVAHEKKYSEGGLVDLQTENQTSIKDIVFDGNLENVTSSEGATTQARKGVLTGLKDANVFDVINEIAINATSANLANVAQVRSKEEEEDDNDEKLNIFEKVFLNFVTDINDDFIKANMPPFFGDIAELLKRGDN